MFRGGKLSNISHDFGPSPEFTLYNFFLYMIGLAINILQVDFFYRLDIYKSIAWKDFPFLDIIISNMNDHIFVLNLCFAREVGSVDTGLTFPDWEISRASLKQNTFRWIPVAKLMAGTSHLNHFTHLS
jgi:hypothetical protein